MPWLQLLQRQRLRLQVLLQAGIGHLHALGLARLGRRESTAQREGRRPSDTVGYQLLDLAERGSVPGVSGIDMDELDDEDGSDNSRACLT